MRTRLLILSMLLCGLIVVTIVYGGRSSPTVASAQDIADTATPQPRDSTFGSVTPTATGLRYDGLYGTGSSSWLRFYEDGTVLAISLSGSPLNGTPYEISQWFNKDSKWANKGAYSVEGSHLKFTVTTSAPPGTIDYEGTIDGDVLTLNVHSHINDYKHTETYKWVSTAPVPPTSTPIPSPTLESGPGLVLYVLGGQDTQVLSEENVGAGQFYLYGDRNQDFKYSLKGDIQGSSYIFDLWLASADTTTFTASIILQQSGRETVLASTTFKVSGKEYQEFATKVDGIDPTTAAGDTLILRISASSAMQGGSIKSGGLAYGDGKASYIKIPHGSPSATPQQTLASTCELLCTVDTTGYRVDMSCESGPAKRETTTTNKYGYTRDWMGNWNVSTINSTVDETITYSNTGNTYKVTGTVSIDKPSGSVSYQLSATGGVLGAGTRSCQGAQGTAPATASPVSSAPTLIATVPGMPTIPGTAPIGSNVCPSYTIKKGDTFGGIAMVFGVSIADLMRANNLKESDLPHLQIGQVLVIPLSGCQLATEVSSAMTPTPLELPTRVPFATPVPSVTAVPADSPKLANQ